MQVTRKGGEQLLLVVDTNWAQKGWVAITASEPPLPQQLGKLVLEEAFSGGLVLSEAFSVAL